MITAQTIAYHALIWIFGVMYAEVSGYIIHRILHTTPEWFARHRWARPFRFMTTSHMGHHALAYGPRMWQRPSRRYIPERVETGKRSTVARFLLPEFTLPGAVMFGVLIALLWVSGLNLGSVAYVVGITIGYSLIAFLYLHDTFHVRDHWLGRIPLVRVWYLSRRRAHDMHHILVDEHGLIPHNLGISSSLMDWLFGSEKRSWPDGMLVDEELGVVDRTVVPRSNIERFYEVYRLEEPNKDVHVDLD